MKECSSTLKRVLSLPLVLLLATTLLLPLTACSWAQKGAEQNNEGIITQKATPKERTQVSVLVKYAFTINSFEKAVEEKFPHIDLVQVGNYTRDMGIEEYNARLKHGDVTDIVMSWPLEVGEQYWSESLLDLSGMPFSSRYNISSLNNIDREGALYYLPGPTQIRGLVYNKTMFEQNGWEVPSNYDEFTTLCQTIEESGIRALQLGLANGEVLDTAFTGFSFAECYSKQQDTRSIHEFNEGTASSFADHFMPALDTFQDLVDKEILRPSDLAIDYSQREKMLFTRACAMVEDSVLLTQMGEDATGITDEFALMPFFNPGDGGDWARLYPVCYVGMGKHLAEPQNKETYQLALEVMDYISTSEGQEAMMSDTGAMYSSLTGIGAPNVPEIEALTSALDHGRYGVFPTLKNAQDALRTGLAGMVQGELTKEQVVSMVDEANASPQSSVGDQKILGYASEDFGLFETGAFVTDALKQAAGTDLALFMDNGMDGRYNGKGISASLYEGEVTGTDIFRILPDLKNAEKGTLCMVSMTGQNVLNTLEYSIPVDNNQTGWFYYFSGLKMTYDPRKEPGTRISNISLADGEPLDLNAIYSIAVMDETVPEEFILELETTHRSIAEILEKTITEQGTISPAKDGRFNIG